MSDIHGGSVHDHSSDREDGPALSPDSLVTGGRNAFEKDGSVAAQETPTTYTLSGTFDVVLIDFESDAATGTNVGVFLFFNDNTTANYNQRNHSGGSTTGANTLTIAGNHNSDWGGVMRVSGRWSNANTLAFSLHNGNPRRNTIAHNGSLDGATSPLDSFTLTTESDGNTDNDGNEPHPTIHVYGRDFE